MKIFQIIAFIYKNTKNKSKMPLYIIRGGVYKLVKMILPDICFSWEIFNGMKIIVYPQAPSTTAFIYADSYDREEIYLLRNICDKNSIFIDIGANVGSYCAMMMDKVKKIIAFEAHPVTFKKLEMLFLLNNYKDYELYNKAVSNKPGKTFFTDKSYLSHENCIASSSEGLEIDSICLDNLILDKTDNYVVKIDVEGFEIEVLEGGKKFFQQNMVNGILFEKPKDYQKKKQKIFKTLSDYGYGVKDIKNSNNVFAQKKFS